MRRKVRLTLILVVFAAGVMQALANYSFAGATQLGQPPTQQQIDTVFSAVTAPDAPGLTVLVRKDGRAIFERGYGVRDLRTRHENDPATNFRLASCTKQFTAMAVMLLVHDGKLAYDTRLTDVFPKFPAYGRSITIRNLLNHTSGLLDYESLMAPEDPNTPPDKLVQISDKQVLALLEKQTTTKFPPGSKWEYSNSGYVLLGLVVEKISGKPFPDFLRERIFVPLGMSNTVGFVKGKNQVANRAFGYSKDANGWRETDQSPTSATLGDGGVYSSVEDLAKWDEALSNHTLLSEAEMQPALTSVVVHGAVPTGPDGEPAAYGFGWFLNPYHGHSRMWHYGETVGFRTNIQRFTSDRLTIIVLCNRTDLNPGALGERVADLFFPLRQQRGMKPLKLPKWLQRLVAVMGGGGLFVVTFLDSSVLSFPFVTDAFVIELSSEHPARMPYYAAMAALGSLAGCIWLYLLAKKGGEAWFHRRAGRGSRRAKRWVERRAFLSVFVPAILPPPFPFKVFVLAEGVFQVRLRVFVIALLLGRGVRYAAEGMFGVRYGQRALIFLMKHGLAFAIVTILVLAVLYGVSRVLFRDPVESE